MAAQVFRRTVHHEICAQRQGLLVDGRGEGVVDGQQRAVAVGDVRYRADVEDLHARVGGRLQEKESATFEQAGLHYI